MITIWRQGKDIFKGFWQERKKNEKKTKFIQNFNSKLVIKNCWKDRITCSESIKAFV